MSIFSPVASRQYKKTDGVEMDSDKQHVEFDISFKENNQLKIETDGCSIISEYLEDKDAERETMSPVNIFYSAFAL